MMGGPVNPTPPGTTGPCGALGEDCCLGAACDENLRCGTNSTCCSIPRGLACEDSSDCCPGMSCVESQCLVDRTGPCLGSSDCAENLACEQGVCGGLARPTCGNEGLPCCSEMIGPDEFRFYCVSGLVCPDMTDCVPCGAMGQACCDGENACPGTIDPDTGEPIQENLVCFEGQCQVPLACGDIAGDPCCGDACAVGLLCNPDTGVCEDDPNPPCVGDCGPPPMPGIDAGPGGGGGRDGGVDGAPDVCGRAGDQCCPGRVSWKRERAVSTAYV